MIVYGWNSYRLKTVTPEEIGIYNSQNDISFEYRQKYFHLFWIPCFPLGKIWSVRQGGQLYHPAPELMETLRSIRAGGKREIWAWSIPLLIVASVLLYNISSSLEEQAFAKRTQANMGILNEFFKDKNKTTPLDKKLTVINALVDSVLDKDEYKAEPVDTSESSLYSLYFTAQLTQLDSLKGYTEENTILIIKFHDKSDRPSILSDDYKTALNGGSWSGYQTDTGVVFSELRKLNNYKYILVLKEYNRLSPVILDKAFNTGYSFINASIIEIETGNVKKSFKMMTANSEEITEFSYRGSEVSKAEWKRNLERDLNKNVLMEAKKYVFGKSSAY